jgi:hypothetical protein
MRQAQMQGCKSRLMCTGQNCVYEPAVTCTRMWTRDSQRSCQFNMVRRMGQVSTVWVNKCCPRLQNRPLWHNELQKPHPSIQYFAGKLESMIQIVGLKTFSQVAIEFSHSR